jgi:hypothetical protein
VKGVTIMNTAGPSVGVLALRDAVIEAMAAEEKADENIEAAFQARDLAAEEKATGARQQAEDRVHDALLAYFEACERAAGREPRPTEVRGAA